MAEMLVDSTKLDACLDAEADAIRAKTGDSNDLTFDFVNNKGFADAIAAIQSGGGGEAYELHSVQITLASSTSMVSILNTYIKECSSWRIYPTDAENTAVNTISIGTAFINSGGNSLSPPIMPTATSATGMTLGSNIPQWYVNDQTYNAIRTRGTVAGKAAGSYQLDFYGVAV